MARYWSGNSELLPDTQQNLPVLSRFQSFQSLSCVWFFVTPWTAACQTSLSFTSPRVCLNSCALSWWCYLTISFSATLFSFCLIFPSIRVFSNESVLHSRSPKYWSFSFSISPSNEYSGLISFRIDWLNLLAVQGTLESLLQHHSSKASILWCSAFFMVQLSQHTWLLEKP